MGGQPETCNGADDDCDGQIDEGCACVNGQTQPCGFGCGNGTQTCVSGAWTTCNAKQPSPETCNNVDDDCDGLVDESLGATTCGVGACARTVSNCAGGATQTCTPGAPGVETCNGLDDNCNGLVDEGLGSTTCGVAEQPFRVTHPAIVSSTPFAPENPPFEYATTKSLVPWRCITGTARDGVHASIAIVPDTGPIAAIRS